MDSPAKRRKTSATTSVSVPTTPAAVATGVLHRTPTRASYLSPTKSSLARSHPQLLRNSTAGTGPSTTLGEGEDNQEAPIVAEGQTPAGALESTAGARAQRVEQTVAGVIAQNRANVGVQRSAQRPAGDTPETPLEEEGGRPSATNNDSHLVNEEDGLPETPAHLREQSSDTPPRGILFSTPSKRFKRNPIPTPKRTTPPQMEEQSAPAVGDTMEEPEAHVQAEPGITLPAKPTPPVDPKEEARRAAERLAIQSKQREKEKLLQQLKELQGKLGRYEQFINKTGNPIVGVSDSELGDLISLIVNDEKGSENQLKPAPLSQLLASFLPFAKPPPPAYTPSATPEDPIASHVPIDLADPLPYLNLFTSCAVTSTINPPSPVSTAGTQQSHDIRISFPQNLLSASVRLTISTEPSAASVPTVSAVDLHNLSPWAEREIGDWLYKRVKEKDVGMLFWGLNSYWELAVSRAECWLKCEQQNFGALAPTAGILAESGGNKGKRKRRSIDSNDAGGESEVGLEKEKGKRKVSKLGLVRHLGRDSFLLEDSSVQLRISWKIQFDHTGEAQSAISAKAAFPRAWRDVDERSSLKKVPETFDVLVRERGVFESIKVMVGLLFPAG